MTFSPLMSSAPDAARMSGARGRKPGRRAAASAFVLLAALLLAVLGAGPAGAEDLTAEQEALAKKIEGELIAPC